MISRSMILHFIDSSAVIILIKWWLPGCPTSLLIPALRLALLAHSGPPASVPHSRPSWATSISSPQSALLGHQHQFPTVGPPGPPASVPHSRPSWATSISSPKSALLGHQNQFPTVGPLGPSGPLASVHQSALLGRSGPPVCPPGPLASVHQSALLGRSGPPTSVHQSALLGHSGPPASVHQSTLLGHPLKLLPRTKRNPSGCY